MNTYIQAPLNDSCAGILVRRRAIALVLLVCLLSFETAYGLPWIQMTDSWRTIWPGNTPVLGDWTQLGFDDTKWGTFQAPVRSDGRDALCRRTFVVDQDTGPVLIRLTHAIRGGAVFFLNGVEIGRFRTDDQSRVTRPLLFACAAGPINLMTNEMVISFTGLQRGTNLLAAELRPDPGIGTMDARRVTSFAAQLELAAPGTPRITSQPQDLGLLQGHQGLLRVVAEGSGGETPVFQWEKDGVAIQGATLDRLTIASASPSTAGIYRVRASTPAGSVWSEHVLFTVAPEAPGRWDPRWVLGVTGTPLGRAKIGGLSIDRKGRILVSGLFTGLDCVGGFGGVGSYGTVARLLPDLTVDTSFVPPSVDLTDDLSHSLGMVRECPDGDILVGGQLRTVNSTAAELVAWLHPDGTVNTNRFLRLTGVPLKPTGSGFAADVLFLDDGSFLLGGEFLYFVNGRVYNGLLHVSADGDVDPDFQAELDASCGVQRIQRRPDGRILVGGYALGRRVGTPPNSSYGGDIVQLLPDGRWDTSFPPHIGLFSTAGIRLMPDGSVYVGARLSLGDTRIYRLLPNGEFDPSYEPVPCPWTPIRSLVALEDGSMVVNGIRRLFPDGTPDPEYSDFDDPQRATYFEGVVGGVVPVGTDRLLVGGDMWTYGGHPVGPLLVVQAPPPRPSLQSKMVVNDREFTATTVDLSWPGWAEGFQLQSREVGASEWKPFQGTPERSLSDGRLHQFIPNTNVGGGASALFRLWRSQ